MGVIRGKRAAHLRGNIFMNWKIRDIAYWEMGGVSSSKLLSPFFLFLFFFFFFHAVFLLSFSPPSRWLHSQTQRRPRHVTPAVLALNAFSLGFTQFSALLLIKRKERRERGTRSCTRASVAGVLATEINGTPWRFEIEPRYYKERSSNHIHLFVYLR